MIVRFEGFGKIAAVCESAEFTDLAPGGFPGPEVTGSLLKAEFLQVLYGGNTNHMLEATKRLSNAYRCGFGNIRKGDGLKKMRMNIVKHTLCAQFL